MKTINTATNRGQWHMGRFTSREWIILAVTILLATTNAHADTVVLTNGDRVSGTITAIEDGTVTLESPLIGSVTIPPTAVQSLETDSPATVLIKDNPTPLKARVSQSAADTVTLVPLSTDSQDAAPYQLDALTEIAAMGTVADARLARPDTSWQWSGAFDAGINGREGNTDRVSFSANLKIKGENPDWKLFGYANTLYAEEEDDITDDEIKGGARVERDITEQLFGFLSVDLERDKIEELDYRGVYSGGLGYQWLPEHDNVSYINRVGLGYQDERYENGDSNSEMIASVVSDFALQVNDHLEITQVTEWIPDLSDVNSYRITAETAGTVYLDDDRSLFIKSGIKNEYDSQPAEDVERLDTYYFTNLGWAF